MKTNFRRAIYSWGTVLVGTGCGGLATQSPGTDAQNTVVSEIGPVPFAASGGGGTVGVGPIEVVPAAPVETAAGGARTVSMRKAEPTPACVGGVQPTVFARPVNISGVRIALTATDVYWNDGTAIVRQAKAGGPPEQVVPNLPPAACCISATADRLFWESGQDIVSTMIAAPAAGVTVARHVTTSKWAPGGETLYALVDQNTGVGGAGGFDRNLPAILETNSITGGAASFGVTLAAESALFPFAADATGAYWGYNQGSDPAIPLGAGGAVGRDKSTSRSRIQKLNFATHQVSDFAPLNGVLQFNALQSDGEWVVWADEDASTNIMQSRPDGSMQRIVASAGLVRGLAVYGSTVYWAASHVGDDYSDIWSAQLGPNSTPQPVACRVQDVYGLAADATDVYYFTYTADPIIGRMPRPSQSEQPR